MIITKLELIRFGQFRDTTVSLQSGAGFYTRENESGKTTVADFIRFMFYGLPYRGRKSMSLQEDLLEKYQPWDSEDGISGAMEFTDERGRCWRVERTQNKKGKGEHRLLDADGNRVETADVGQTFLGMDSDTFSNVFFIGAGSPAFHRTEQMEIAMRNLVTTGSETVGYDSVMEFLNGERAKYVSPKGNSGKLKRLEAEIELLRRQLAVDRVGLEQRESALGATADMEETDDEQLAYLQAQAARGAAYAAWQRYQKQLQLTAQAEQLRARIEGSSHPLTEEEKDELSEGFTEKEGGEYLLAQAEREWEQLRQQSPQLEEKDKQLLQYESAAHIGGGMIALLAALSGAFAVTAVLALLWNVVMWIAAGITGIGFLLAGFFALRLPRSVTTLGIRDRAALRRELSRIKAAQEQLWQLQREQAAAQKAVEERREHLAVLERKYAPLREKTGIFDRKTLEQILAGNLQAEVLEQRLQDVKAQLAELGEVTPVTEAEPPALSAAEIEQRRAALQAQKDARQQQQLRLAGQRAELERDRAQLAVRAEELEDKCRQAEQMRRACQVVTLAIEQMEQAQAKLRENYAPRLRQAMSEKLAMLTDGKYDTVMLDEALSVRIKADGGMRALGYFSGGTRAAAMLALRLSLVEILEGERRLPMIFDDPFLHLDASRMAILRRYLEQEGQRRQILLLSCREI